MQHHHHLYAIGNALVDSEYEVTDDHLQRMGVDKRHMTLIDAARRAASPTGLRVATSPSIGG